MLRRPAFCLPDHFKLANARDLILAAPPSANRSSPLSWPSPRTAPWGPKHTLTNLAHFPMLSRRSYSESRFPLRIDRRPSSSCSPSPPETGIAPFSPKVHVYSAGSTIYETVSRILHEVRIFGTDNAPIIYFCTIQKLFSCRVKNLSLTDFSCYSCVS